MKQSILTLSLSLLMLTFLFTSCNKEYEHKDHQKHEHHKKSWSEEDYKSVKSCYC